MTTAKRKDGIEVLVEEELDEERVLDELCVHPTRDDVHEQREDEQICEGVLHAHVFVVVRH